jgi:hypothetical protein
MRSLGKSIEHRNISAIANSSGLIRITTSSAHGLSTGHKVSIEGVLGTTEANGRWTITVTSTTQFTLDGSAFANTYASGGKVYLPHRLKFQLSATPAGGSAYVWASVSWRRFVDGNVVDANTQHFKITNTTEVPVLDSFGGGVYWIDEIEFRNKSNTTVTALVEVEEFDETLEPMSVQIATGERATWTESGGDTYSATGARNVGASGVP